MRRCPQCSATQRPHQRLVPLRTNLLIAAIRKDGRGLKWSVPAMLLAVPYLYAAAICTTIISHASPGWLNLLVILCIWNGLQDALVRPGHPRPAHQDARTGNAGADRWRRAGRELLRCPVS